MKFQLHERSHDEDIPPDTGHSAVYLPTIATSLKWKTRG
jgi:hypothetical protein